MLWEDLSMRTGIPQLHSLSQSLRLKYSKPIKDISFLISAFKWVIEHLEVQLTLFDFGCLPWSEATVTGHLEIPLTLFGFWVLALGDVHTGNNKINKNMGFSVSALNFKMWLSVSEGWQGVSFESVFVWSFLFWNESVLAQNYTKKFCQETLSFVSMRLQIFPNKFDGSQQEPAFILTNKSTSPHNIHPWLAESTGTALLSSQCP